MRLVVALCSVDYEGRLEAHLPLAKRLIMVKADGCVAIHADGGAYKPLNWMNAPNSLTELDSMWEVTNPKGEKLTIRIEEVFSDERIDMGIDPGLEKDGVETQLQVLLADRVEFLEEGLTLIRREYPTAVGPVDLLCRDANGDAVAIEIKRKAGIDGVEQLTRYREFLSRDKRLGGVRGMLVALSVSPQARILAEDRDLLWREVDYDDLRQREGRTLRLF